MTRRLQLAPSILTADLARLADEIGAVSPYIDWLHLDVMDGHYVENITFGADVVAAISRVTDLPLHVHLMISDPGTYASRFADAGARRISFHPETVAAPEVVLDLISASGAGGGIAVHPDKDLSVADRFLDRLDVLIVMTVRPGWGGQAFIEEVVPKIEQARHLIDERALSVDLEIDGGVNLRTVDRAVGAGGDVLVAGSAVFDGKDPAAAARSMRSRLDELARTSLIAGEAP